MVRPHGATRAGAGRYRALLIEGDPVAVEAARGAAERFPQLELAVLAGVDGTLAWLRSGVADEPVADIILIDLELPKLDGLALLRTIRNSSAMRNIPIVAFSPEHTPADVVTGYQVGANTFVAKPGNEEQFGSLLREQIEYWTRHHQHGKLAAAVGD